MTVPNHVLAEWRAIAEQYERRQRKWHDDHEHNQPFLSCWFCGRARATCKGKKRHESLEDAQQHCDQANHPNRSRLLVPYRCFWSEGLHWHATTADTTSRKRRARKRMARLVRGGGGA